MKLKDMLKKKEERAEGGPSKGEAKKPSTSKPMKEMNRTVIHGVRG